MSKRETSEIVTLVLAAVHHKLSGTPWPRGQVCGGKCILLRFAPRIIDVVKIDSTLPVSHFPFVRNPPDKHQRAPRHAIARCIHPLYNYVMSVLPILGKTFWQLFVPSSSKARRNIRSVDDSGKCFGHYRATARTGRRLFISFRSTSYLTSVDEAQDWCPVKPGGRLAQNS